MSRQRKNALLPDRIVVAGLGELKLVLNEFHRHYELPGPFVLGSGRVRVKPGGIELFIWAFDVSTPDAQEIAKVVESRLAALKRDFDSILDSSIPVITEAIEYFWQISDPAPSARQLIKTGELRQINLNAEPGPHLIIIHDEGDLIGGHDLCIELDSNLQPHSAHFDG